MVSYDVLPQSFTFHQSNESIHIYIFHYHLILLINFISNLLLFVRKKDQLVCQNHYDCMIDYTTNNIRTIA